MDAPRTSRSKQRRKGTASPVVDHHPHDFSARKILSLTIITRSVTAIAPAISYHSLLSDASRPSVYTPRYTDMCHLWEIEYPLCNCTPRIWNYCELCPRTGHGIKEPISCPSFMKRTARNSKSPCVACVENAARQREAYAKDNAVEYAQQLRDESAEAESAQRLYEWEECRKIYRRRTGTMEEMLLYNEIFSVEDQTMSGVQGGKSFTLLNIRKEKHRQQERAQERELDHFLHPRSFSNSIRRALGLAPKESIRLGSENGRE